MPANYKPGLAKAARKKVVVTDKVKDELQAHLPYLKTGSLWFTTVELCGPDVGRRPVRLHNAATFPGGRNSREFLFPKGQAVIFIGSEDHAEHDQVTGRERRAKRYVFLVPERSTAFYIDLSLVVPTAELDKDR